MKAELWVTQSFIVCWLSLTSSQFNANCFTTFTARLLAPGTSKDDAFEFSKGRDSPVP
ncbi:hypothetical protein M378DRAFT_171867, partial [Amanita muscaria Koide BX008]